jgi:hypothetical protein
VTFRVIHPPAVGTLRAFKSAPQICTPKPYLVRNNRIVSGTELLIAAGRVLRATSIGHIVDGSLCVSTRATSAPSFSQMAAVSCFAKIVALSARSG